MPASADPRPLRRKLPTLSQPNLDTREASKYATDLRARRKWHFRTKRELLELCADPRSSNLSGHLDDPGRGDAQHRYAANIHYLEEHGLVDANMDVGPDNYGIAWPTITAKGMDFLPDAAGLTAILGVVTVKFAVDELRQLLAEKIASSDLAESQKTGFLTRLADLPNEALKHGANQLIHAGIDHVPNAFDWFTKLFS